MRPIGFDEANVTLKAPPGMEGEVLDLPVHRSDEPALVVSCWALEPGELEEIQRTGCVWLSVQGRTHAPLYVTARPPFDPPEP